MSVISGPRLPAIGARASHRSPPRVRRRQAGVWPCRADYREPSPAPQVSGAIVGLAESWVHPPASNEPRWSCRIAANVSTPVARHWTHACPPARSSEKWARAQVRDEAGQPGEQAQVQGHRRRLRPRRRRRRRDPGRARLRRRVLLLPGLAAPRALDRRAGRHQRREELPERRRQRSTACSTTRSRAATSAPREANVHRLAEVSRSTSSISASRWACRSRASTAARSRTAASAARRCRARSTPAARPASSSCSACTPALSRQIAAGKVKMFTAHRDARRRRRGRPRGRHRRARPGHRRDRRRTPAHAVVLATGGYGNVFYLSTNAKGCNVTATYRAYKRGAGVREPVLHADPPDLHPGRGRLPVEADADVGVAAQRRPGLGAEAQGRHRRSAPTRSPTTSATTTSSASTRASATCRRATSRAAPRRRCATRAAASGPAAAACTSTSATRSRATART